MSERYVLQLLHLLTLFETGKLNVSAVTRPLSTMYMYSWMHQLDIYVFLNSTLQGALLFSKLLASSGITYPAAVHWQLNVHMDDPFWECHHTPVPYSYWTVYLIRG